MADDIITKRLHISGLTPNLTKEDLSKRMTSFGTIKAVDGFGLSDGLGEPRKFGYVTIEGTTAKLAKCVNVLSGTIWKGAKLRIGDAKPDFTERIEAEHTVDVEPPKKKRKRTVGTESADMDLVTPDNSVERGAWRVTPLGRMVRPIRMRPEKPIGPPLEAKKPTGVVKFKDSEIGNANGKGVRAKNKDGAITEDDKKKRKKKREKVPDERARRKTIDMTRWGSTHLKGMFLDVEPSGKGPDVRDEEVWESENSDVENAEADVEMEALEEAAAAPSAEDITAEFAVAPAVAEAPAPSLVPEEPKKKKASLPPVPLEVEPPPAHKPKKKVKVSEVMAAPATVVSLPNDNTNVALEKSQSLHLLQSLFGSDNEDWGGAESVGSDVDVNDNRGMGRFDEHEEFEEVPRDFRMEDSAMEVDTEARAENAEEEAEVIEQVEVDEDESEAEAKPKVVKPPTVQQALQVKLKDLFAPREEDTGFSLFGNMELDLELDDEIMLPPAPAPVEATSSHTAWKQPAYQPTAVALPPQTAQMAHEPTPFDPRQPLFFPVSTSSSQHTTPYNTRVKDLFTVARENGWNWRDAQVGFYRTDSDEDIRKRWEEQKVDLTKDWKRRCREAGKMRKRRGGEVD